MITISLPMPPSVNELYLVRPRRRIKSPKYRSWLRSAAWQIKAQRLRPIDGPWRIAVVLPRGMKGDCDNRLKGLLDALVLSGIVEDDRRCVGINVEKTGETPEAVVILRAANG
jgi:Holliday junction resolvase RusA-like endonuclease